MNDQKKQVILVVDDEPIILDLLEEFLLTCNYRVITAKKRKSGHNAYSIRCPGRNDNRFVHAGSGWFRIASLYTENDAGTAGCRYNRVGD